MSSLVSKIGLIRTTLTTVFVTPSYSAIQIRNYAARKGTRERRMKKLRKNKPAVVQKVGWIPHNILKKEKMLANRSSKKVDDSKKKVPIDDVFVMKYYQWINYSFEAAVQCHRETHHPDMYNVPNSPLHVSIELNMQGEKKTRFVDNFTRIVAIPHRFDHGEDRTIIAFAKSAEEQKAALDAGATIAGGPELIKQIQGGHVSLNDYQFSIAHPDILAELVSLRGLLKRNFPNPRAGTLDSDLGVVTQKLMHGIQYSGKKDEYEKDFGLVETRIGTLDMDTKCLEENFKCLLLDLFTLKPRREGSFILRCLLWSPPSSEKFKVNHLLYLPDEVAPVQRKLKEEVNIHDKVVLEHEEEGETEERVTL